MRTVVLICGLLVYAGLGGDPLPPFVTKLLAGVFLATVTMDIVDFLKG